MLTKKEIKQLRKEIILNSLFLDDYDNTLYIKNKTVCAFFDSYIEELYYIAKDNNFNSDNIIDVIDKYDNIDNLYNCYLSFEGNVLLQNDIIVSKPLNNFDSVVIYDIKTSYIENYVKAAFMVVNGLYTDNTKIKTYKLYESVNKGYYFKIKNQRYYINDFMRADF